MSSLYPYTRTLVFCAHPNKSASAAADGDGEEGTTHLKRALNFVSSLSRSTTPCQVHCSMRYSTMKWYNSPGRAWCGRWGERGVDCEAGAARAPGSGVVRAQWFFFVFFFRSLPPSLRYSMLEEYSGHSQPRWKRGKGGRRGLWLPVAGGRLSSMSVLLGHVALHLSLLPPNVVSKKA